MTYVTEAFWSHVYHFCMEKLTKVKTFPSLNYLVRRLEGGHQEIINKTEELKKMLTNLRYEGRASYGKNLKEIRHVAIFFENELSHHFHLKKKSFFHF